MPGVLIRADQYVDERLPARSKDLIEEGLACILATGFAISANDIEFDWDPSNRTRNAASVRVYVYYSTGRDGVWKKDKRKRKRKLRQAILMYLETTPLLSHASSVSVWMLPAPGGSYTQGMRKKSSS